jgi:hypothetical protein
MTALPITPAPNPRVRGILIASGYICLAVQLSWLWFVSTHQAADRYSAFVSLGLILFTLLLYDADNDHIGARERDTIPVLGSNFFVAGLPFVGVPTYLNWYRKTYHVSSGFTIATIGWVLFGALTIYDHLWPVVGK